MSDKPLANVAKSVIAPVDKFNLLILLLLVNNTLKTLPFRSATPHVAQFSDPVFEIV